MESVLVEIFASYSIIDGPNNISFYTILKLKRAWARPQRARSKIELALSNKFKCIKACVQSCRWSAEEALAGQLLHSRSSKFIEPYFKSPSSALAQKKISACCSIENFGNIFRPKNKNPDRVFGGHEKSSKPKSPNKKLSGLRCLGSTLQAKAMAK